MPDLQFGLSSGLCAVLRSIIVEQKTYVLSFPMLLHMIFTKRSTMNGKTEGNKDTYQPNSPTKMRLNIPSICGVRFDALPTSEGTYSFLKAGSK